MLKRQTRRPAHEGGTFGTKGLIMPGDKLVRGVLQGYMAEVSGLMAALPVADIERVVQLLLDAHREGRCVYLCGNGGSAATASHFASDLSKSTIVDGQTRLRVGSLTDNTALLTAWANDASYEKVFAEQIESLIQPGDVLIAISASGNSANIVAAVEAAARRGGRTAALVGFSGGRLKDLVEVAVHAPSFAYGPVEDAHLAVAHAITAALRARRLAASSQLLEGTTESLK